MTQSRKLASYMESADEALLAAKRSRAADAQIDAPLAVIVRADRDMVAAPPGGGVGALPQLR